MTATVKVWDRESKDGAPIDMYAVRAKEAIARAPSRFSLTKPDEGDPPHTNATKERPSDKEGYPIPEEWADLEWPLRRKLAVQLGAPVKCNSETANAVIAAEQRRRKELIPDED
jgi:hypothetical protein